MIETRSNTLVQITNALDIVFPEFKAHFSNRLGLTALYILKKYKTPEKISKLTKNQFQTISNKSMGKFTYPKFLKLKDLAKNTIGIKSNSITTVMIIHIDLFHSINTNIEILENEIKKIMSLTNCKMITIPGISLMSAATIFGEVMDFNNFSNPAKLIAFSGFDIAIYQSGESLSYGKLVKRGSSLLRKTIWNLVLGSIRLIPEITEYYHKKRAEGKHRNVILSAISRKLLRIIYHLETNNVSYDKNKIR